MADSLDADQQDMIEQFVAVVGTNSRQVGLLLPLSAFENLKLTKIPGQTSSRRKWLEP